MIIFYWSRFIDTIVKRDTDKQELVYCMGTSAATAGLTKAEKR